MSRDRTGAQLDPVHYATDIYARHMLLACGLPSGVTMGSSIEHPAAPKGPNIYWGKQGRSYSNDKSLVTCAECLTAVLV